MHRIKTRQSRTRRLLCFTLGVSASFVAQANPQAPTVAAGTVNFGNPNASTLEITNSPNAIINWQSFDIGVGETTRFVQQGAASAVLNRVTTQNPSDILGSLVSNGRVFLVNPAGILIGRDGMVDTAGLVMSTLNITNENFLAGRFEFTGDAASGQITNHGYIKTTPGGEIVLLAPSILNAPEAGNDKSGIIESENGQLVLAAGYSITITSLDDPDISFEVTAPAGEVVNLGQLIARGGSVEVLAETIRHSGEINADALSVDASGRIVLTATKNVETSATSVISARGERLPTTLDDTAASDADEQPNPAGADGGNVSITVAAAPTTPETVTTSDAAAPAPATATAVLAGRVDVTGAHGGTASVEADTVTVQGTIDASGRAGGGSVQVLGTTVNAEAATVRANADIGPGGDIRFGGELQGADTLRAAETTTVDAASRFEANATTRGDGGEVVVWSNVETAFAGTAEARAGVDAGDGGLVEVSGKETLRFAGSVDVGAPGGSAGTLLLDPKNILIVPGGASLSIDNPTPFAGDGFGSNFSVLGNGNILVVNQNADAPGLTDAGEITLLDANGNVLGSVVGNASNERLGSFGSFTFPNPAGNRFFRSPNASNGALAGAGALLLFDITTGAEIGRTSGQSAGELFSQGTINSSSGNLIVSSTLADVGGNVDAGSVVVINGVTGTALGQLNGSSASEFFGTTVRVGFTVANTFVVESATADIGGLVDAGRVVMGSAVTGAQLGQVVGTTAGDQIGSTVDYFSTGAGTYLIRSAVADVGGLVDAGTAILVNNSTGNEIGRTNGLAAGDNLGSFGPVLRASGNYFLQVPNADIGGATDAGSLVLANGATGARIASLNGSGTGEQLGLNIDTFSLGNSNVLVISDQHDNPGIGTVDDQAGGVFVVADVDLGSFTILRGSVLGSSAGEQLGSDGVINAFNGNFWIPSTNFETSPSNPAMGTVILVDGTTGNEIGRVDGTDNNEQFGSDLFAGQLFNGDLLVRSVGHNGGAGSFVQIAPVDLGSGVIVRNTVNGVTAGDFTGADFEVLSGGNYVISAPSFDAGNINSGQVFVIDGGSGATLGTITGDSINEGLGSDLEFDLFRFNIGGSAANHFAILSAGHGGNSEGAVFFVDGSTGSVLRTVNGNTSDTIGGFPLELVFGLHVAIRNPLSDTGGANAGEILFVDPFANYATSGSVLGISAGEQLGDASTEIDLSSLAGLGTGMFLIHTPNRDVSGKTDAGAVLIMQGTFNAAVTLQGAISGLEDQDFLGLNGASDVRPLSGGRFVLFNPGGDDPTGAPGIQNDEGAVILGSATTFNEIGRFYGQTGDNENLGSGGVVTERPNGNFFINAPGAGANGEGALYLADGATGTAIGRVDGTAPNENFGSSLDTFTLTNGDVLVFSQSHSVGGNANAGTVVQAVSDGSLGGGNLVRGRVDGGSAGELLGQFGAAPAGDGAHYYLASRLADPGGLADAGSIYFVDQTTGALSNRIDGTSAGELLGNGGVFQFGTNLFVRSQLADVGGAVDAGRVILAAAAGATIGVASGNAANEFFGTSFQFVDGDIWVTAGGHNSGAGGIFALANQDLGGGNIVRASLLGAAAGDALGALGLSFISATNVLVRVPLADVGGIVDAGRALMVNRSLQILGRTDGTSANEQYGSTFQFLSNGNLLFRSPDADIGGLVDAGVVKLVSPTSGALIGQTAGTSANERFGVNFGQSLGNNGFFIVSQNADPGGLVDAGAVVQISSETGLETQRIVGTSAGELFGSFGFTSANGRLIFGSPLADVGGLVDAGRIVIFDPTAANQGNVATNVLFSNTPNGDFVITTGAIENALKGGANLVLQSNNDIVIPKGLVLNGAGGSLTLQAGRSVIINGLLNLPGTDLKIVAGQNQDGVDVQNRDSGSSEFALFDPQIVGKTVDISADLVSLTGGSTPSGETPLIWTPVDSTAFFQAFLRDGTGYPAAFVLGIDSLTVNAPTINLTAGTAPGAFAALVSLGDHFTVKSSSITLTPGTAPGAHALFLGLGGVGDFTFDTCVGCGNQLLFSDPFLEGGAPVSGFFVSGLLQNPAIDSILAMLDRDEDEEDKKKKRCN